MFEATHALLLRLVAEGLIDGLRVDHPDGLADPRGYLARLANATGGAWVVTEKILTGAEELPQDWWCAGTTGYDALGTVGGLFTDPAGAGPLTTTYTRFTEGTPRFADVAETAKREVARHSLAAEVYRLGPAAARAGHPGLSGLSFTGLHEVLTELLTAVDVYRAYVVPGEPPPATSVRIVAAAAASASHRLPPRLRDALTTVSGLVLGRDSDAAWAAEFAVRFQQTCGPVMAKGVEDTAFYRWPRLTSLNEVGGDPERLAVSPAGFHAFAARLARDWPATMTTLSTHDTKRQEDVRARLAVLAEIPRRWAAEVAGWHDRAVTLTPGHAPSRTPSTCCGRRWPVPGRSATTASPGTWSRRCARRRPARPGPTRTRATRRACWPSPRPSSATPSSPGAIAAFVSGIAADARVNSLGAKLVQLTMPGVPDVYQGCELAGFALVDPDNRRPVDYSLRRALLAALDGGAARANSSAGSPAAGLDAEKLLVTARALRLRRDHPDWFAGGYAPLAATGPAAPHAVAFRRGDAVTVATRLPAGLRRTGRLGGHRRWRCRTGAGATCSPAPLMRGRISCCPIWQYGCRLLF